MHSVKLTGLMNYDTKPHTFRELERHSCDMLHPVTCSIHCILLGVICEVKDTRTREKIEKGDESLK